MLSEICSEIKNYFTYNTIKYVGEFHIVGGELQEDCELQNKQYYRIVGSVFNDGVHQHPATDLHDETWSGGVWQMAVPQEIIDLSEEIDTWKTNYGGADSVALSPFTSESFGGYSYTKGATSSGGGITWKTVFADRLNKWRKIRP